MKKIITIILAMLLVFSLSVSSFAATISDLLTSETLVDPSYVRPDITAEVKLPTGTYAASATLTAAGVSTSNPVAFDFKSTLGLNDVVGVKLSAAINGGDERIDVIDNADVHIKGQFTVTIKYPSIITVDSSELATGTMHGFTKNAENGNMVIYNDTARNLVDNGDGTSTITIEVEVKNPDDATLDYITGTQLVTHPEYFGDIEYTFTGNIGAYGSYPVTVTMRGETEVVDDSNNHLMTIKYIPADPKSATATAIIESVTVTPPGRPSTGTTVVTPPVDPVGPGTDKKEIPVVVRGQEPVSVPVKNGKVKIEDIEVPEREGFVVAGFYADPTYTEPLEGEIDVDELDNIYVKHINVVPPKNLNAEDHHAYVIGYPDGSIGPNDNIARDEVATILYRLLNDDERAAIESENSKFNDVTKELWSNKYVSTMTNGGFIKGYDDGSFRPEAPITRGELVTILARIYGDQLPEITDDIKCEYTDIEGHWAEDYIKAIYLLEIVNGYEDGTFRPDQYITRAEVMAIVNRSLVRYAHEDGVIDGEYVEWGDCHVNDWYYYDVVEATNTHDYDRHDNGYNETHTEYGQNEWTSTGVYNK